MIARLWRRLRGREPEEDSEEVALHLSQLEDAYREQGFTEQEAHAAARRQFGNVTKVQEESHEMFSVPVFDNLVQDVRYALRTLRKSPSFSIVAVFTVGLGIAATTVVFSVVSAVLLKPLPYPSAARIVHIVENVPPAESITGRPMRLPSMSPQEFDWWRSNTTVLEYLAVTLPETRQMTTDSGTVLLQGQRVSPALFPMRGVQPIRGRWMDPNEERAQVVILSAGTWQRYFNSSADVVGNSVVLSGQTFAIAGVMPREFGEEAFWLPYAVEPPRDGARQLVSVVGLLKEGITIEAAATEINTLGARLRSVPSGPSAVSRFEVVREQDQMVANVRPVLRMLVAAVGLVLLIVCANVANLLLVRGTARGREIGIRRALGASRRRIVSQLLTEGVVLSLAGGAIGVALAYVGVPLLRNGSVIEIPDRFRNALGVLGPDILPRGDEMTIDPAVLAFAFGTSLVSGILFTLAPALRLARAGRSAGLGSGSNLSARSGSAAGENRIGRLLAISQIGLATTLLIGSGLLLHSFLNLSTLFLGFDPGTQIFQLVAPEEYPRARKLALAYELSERLMAQSAVASAGFVNTPPLASGRISVNYYVPADQEYQIDSMTEEDKTIIRGVSPGYLPALGARLVEGRWLDARDKQSQSRAMLVNRAWAQRFSPRGSPVGKTVVFNTQGRVRRRITWEVVGVVENIRWTYEGQPAEKLPLLGFMDLSQLLAQSVGDRDVNAPSMDLDMLTGQPNGVAFAVRTSSGQLGATDLRSIAIATDPALTVEGVATMGSLYSGLIGRQRFYAIVVNLFGAIAGVIAAIGIYGVLAYAVARRTQEFGIRMALGARPRDVLRLVLGQGLTLIAMGMGAGVAGAIALTRYLAGMLYGLTALDPLTYVVVALSFTVVTILASYLPARRATRVDPLVALRYE